MSVWEASGAAVAYSGGRSLSASSYGGGGCPYRGARDWKVDSSSREALRRREENPIFLAGCENQRSVVLYEEKRSIATHTVATIELYLLELSEHTIA